HELERGGHVHPAVQQHQLRRARGAPVAHVIAQSAHLEELRLAVPHVSGNATCGVRPEITSASRLAEPQASVQPSVPWPVLRYRLRSRVLPITGTLLGVAGRRPVQLSTTVTPPSAGK